MDRPSILLRRPLDALSLVLLVSILFHRYVHIDHALFQTLRYRFLTFVQNQDGSRSMNHFYSRTVKWIFFHFGRRRFHIREDRLTPEANFACQLALAAERLIQSR